MNHYRARTLIPGWKVDKSLSGKTLVAVPEESLKRSKAVEYNRQIMVVSGEPLWKIKFKDKYNRDKEYTLLYYEWIPKIEGDLFK